MANDNALSFVGQINDEHTRARSTSLCIAQHKTSANSTRSIFANSAVAAPTRCGSRAWDTAALITKCHGSMGLISKRATFVIVDMRINKPSASSKSKGGARV
jgi:hypothetical protein